MNQISATLHLVMVCHGLFRFEQFGHVAQIIVNSRTVIICLTDFHNHGLNRLIASLAMNYRDKWNTKQPPIIIPTQLQFQKPLLLF